MSLSDKWRCDTFKMWTVGSILFLGLITPSLVRLGLEVWLGGHSIFMGLQHVLGWHYTAWHKFSSLALYELIPFVALSVIVFCLPGKVPREWIILIGLLGLLGILVYMVPAYVSVWRPLYTGARMSSTASIAFAFIPFYCLGTMVIGLAVAGLTAVISALLRLFHSGSRGGNPSGSRGINP